MKILLVGSGGRESAIAFKIIQSEKVSKIYVAPGNGGTALYEKCENLNITDIDELLSFSKENNIDLTIVGPEEPLTKGIVDKFRSEGLRIFGPDKKGAELEGSKSFSKDFMKKYGVSTAEYEIFYDTTYNNEAKDVPAKQTDVVVVTKDNVKSALIDSGYYEAGDFTGLE